jgi:uncharacterized protein YjiS (DUF1127 family)
MESPAGMCRPKTPHAEPAGRVGRLRTGPARLVVRCVASVSAWRKRRRDRQLLASLDDRSLRDIGIDRAKVEDESSVSFWRLR